MDYVGYIDGCIYPYRACYPENFNNVGKYPPFGYVHARPIPKTPEIEITVKVNGKEVSLSEISDETLLKIKEKSG